jgi:hypothetical protein
MAVGEGLGPRVLMLQWRFRAVDECQEGPAYPLWVTGEPAWPQPSKSKSRGGFCSNHRRSCSGVS